jgi:YebC/PmpR family DNA-binding regulatory protein
MTLNFYRDIMSKTGRSDMSGHSKWATTKHKKAAVDARRGKAFTQVSNMITVAAKQGGADPKMNFALRLAVEKAKAVNMPTANVDRAIKRGTGEGGGARIEEFTYEGYGPSGIAVLVETASDNKNRTVGEIRAAFTKYGGSLATAGAVAYLFDHKGHIVLNTSDQKITKDEIEMVVIESGADDFEDDEETITVYTKPNELAKVKDSLEASGLTISDAGFAYIAKTEISVKDVDKAKSIFKLLDALESCDDVVAVHANFDIPEDVMKELE